LPTWSTGIFCRRTPSRRCNAPGPIRVGFNTLGGALATT
jgi:hypothetical protein